MCNEENKSGVEVLVDVTKIVKYVAIAAVCIVAIIFGTNYAKRQIELQKRD